MKDHFFVGNSGELFDTRKDRWSSEAPLRKIYSRHFSSFEGNSAERLAKVKATIRAGVFSYLGMYRLAFITKYGESLCFDCARREFRLIVDDILGDYDSGWNVVALECEANTDSDCFCNNCNNRIW